MRPITEKTVKVLSTSGFVLIVPSMIGSFALAASSVSRNIQAEAWNDIFGLLFLAVMGIGVYYLALSLFGWAVLKTKKA